MKLYNMEEQEWRTGKFQRGNTWRSEEVSECTVCGTRTNRWEMGGYPGMGPRLHCPGGVYREHDEIVGAHERQKELKSLIVSYESELQHQCYEISAQTRGYIATLLHMHRAEYSLLQGKIDRLRELFTEKLLHDVKGIKSELTVVVPCTPFTSGGTQKKSLQKGKI